MDDDNLDALSKLLFEEDKESDTAVSNTPNRKRSSPNPSRDEPSPKKPTKEGEDEVRAMKAKMLEMERQLNELKKQIQSGDKQTREGHQKVQPSIKSGKRNRVAHESKAKSTPNKVGVVNNTVNDESCDTEHYSGLRLKNMSVSTEAMREKMKGRRMIRIPQILSNIKDGDIDGDWVTIGVIVYKLPPKDTAKGSKFSVWKLSDLSSQTSLISLFLFDQVFEKHWKISVGHVIALLNAKILTNRESNSSTGVSGSQKYSLSLDHPGKLMSLGASHDFTICQATTKSGKKCSNFASKQHGSRCDYHIHGEYSKLMSRRMDCQGGSVAPNVLSIQERVLGRSDVFHKGHWFSGEKAKYQNVLKGNTDMTFVPGAKERYSEVQEVLGKELAGNCVKKFKSGVMTQSGGEIFKQLMQSETPGARCYQNFLNKNTTTKEKKDNADKERTALQLLQEHSVKKSNDTEVKDTIEKHPKLSQPFELELFAPDIKLSSNKENIDKTRPSISKKKLSSNTMTGNSQSKSNSVTVPKEREKLKKLQAKEHAMSVLAKSETEDNKQKSMNTRIQKNLEKDLPNEDKSCTGNLDVDKLEKILSAKSSHQWAVKQDESLLEERYFENLEKREAVEERLKDLKELNVRVIQCKECNYVAESISDLCHKEKHVISRLRAIKRCFSCSMCGYRQYTYNSRYPTVNCQCGENKFNQTSVYPVRKGPKLPGEELSLRGDEQKFLNSLN